MFVPRPLSDVIEKAAQEWKSKAEAGKPHPDGCSCCTARLKALLAGMDAALRSTPPLLQALDDTKAGLVRTFCRDSDIILRDFNAQLFEPSRDRIHRPTRPIKIRWCRATDKIWPVQQPLACCVLPITMIDFRKKRQTDLLIARVPQFCSTSIGWSLRPVGSSHAGCLHTFGLGHRQTYLKNFHVLDEEPCNIAAQTLRQPLLRPCQWRCLFLGLLLHGYLSGHNERVQGHAPAPPGSYSRSWRMPHWTFPDPRKAQGILTAPLFIPLLLQVLFCVHSCNFELFQWLLNPFCFRALNFACVFLYCAHFPCSDR